MQVEKQVDTMQIIQKLVKATINEKLCPDILPYETALIDHLTTAKNRQQDTLTQFEENNQMSNSEKNFRLTIYRLEVERISYLIKEYLRTRLFKIQTYSFHILKENQLSNLSQEEQEFVVGYAKLRYDLYEEIVMKDMHKDFKGLGGVESFFNGTPNTSNVQKKMGSKQAMVNLERPNKDEFVFIKILENPEDVRYQHDIKVLNLPEDENNLIMANDVIMMPYKQGERFLKDGLAVLF